MTLRPTRCRVSQALHALLDGLHSMLQLALPLLLQRADLCLQICGELLEVGELAVVVVITARRGYDRVCGAGRGALYSEPVSASMYCMPCYAILHSHSQQWWKWPWRAATQYCAVLYCCTVADDLVDGRRWQRRRSFPLLALPCLLHCLLGESLPCSSRRFRHQIHDERAT